MEVTSAFFFSKYELYFSQLKAYLTFTSLIKKERFLGKGLLVFAQLRVTVLYFCFDTVTKTKLKIWNLLLIHSSDAAQHTTGILVFTPRKIQFLF